MKFANTVRQYWAALRALLVFTVICGFGYPLLIWLVALIPGLHDTAEGSIVTAGGKPVGSELIGQLFTDSNGNALPQYFQDVRGASSLGSGLRLLPMVLGMVIGMVIGTRLQSVRGGTDGAPGRSAAGPRSGGPARVARG